MIDTNALLNCAFALISNFAAVVDVPLSAVPHGVGDLERYVISTPMFPTSVYLVHRKGTEFWLDWGAVQGYRSPGSFFSLQDPDLIPKFTGTTTLSSNDVISIAARALERLVKKGNPLTNGIPWIQQPGLYKGEVPIPFFRVTWPNGNGREGPTAEVEIDGRSGTIVSLDLYDRGFFDRDLDHQIRDRVYEPEPQPPPKPRPVINWPQPTTNYVSLAITNWVAFCTRFGLQPGTRTNLADVDWQNTWVSTNAPFYPRPTGKVEVVVITLLNGARFDSLDGQVFFHSGEDACFKGSYLNRPNEEWGPFQGVVMKDWRDLARDLEMRLARELGPPAAVLKSCRPVPVMWTEPVGKMGLARNIIYWHRQPREPYSDPAGEDIRSPLCAEVDLQTGQVNLLQFQDPRLLGSREKKVP